MSDTEIIKILPGKMIQQMRSYARATRSRSTFPSSALLNGSRPGRELWNCRGPGAMSASDRLNNTDESGLIQSGQKINVCIKSQLFCIAGYTGGRVKLRLSSYTTF